MDIIEIILLVIGFVTLFFVIRLLSKGNFDSKGYIQSKTRSIRINDIHSFFEEYKSVMTPEVLAIIRKATIKGQKYINIPEEVLFDLSVEREKQRNKELEAKNSKQ